MNIDELLKPTFNLTKFGIRKMGGGVLAVKPQPPIITKNMDSFEIESDEGTIYYRFKPATTGEFGEWTEYEEEIEYTDDTEIIVDEYDEIEAKVVVNGQWSDVAYENQFIRPILTSFYKIDGEAKFGYKIEEYSESETLVLEYYQESWKPLENIQNFTGEIEFKGSWSLIGEYKFRAYTKVDSKESEKIELDEIVVAPYPPAEIKTEESSVEGYATAIWDFDEDNNYVLKQLGEVIEITIEGNEMKADFLKEVPANLIITAKAGSLATEEVIVYHAGE